MMLFLVTNDNIKLFLVTKGIYVIFFSHIDRADALSKLHVSHGLGVIVGPTLGGWLTTLNSEQFAAGLQTFIRWFHPYICPMPIHLPIHSSTDNINHPSIHSSIHPSIHSFIPFIILLISLILRCCSFNDNISSSTCIYFSSITNQRST